MNDQREVILEQVSEARAPGARLSRACEVIGISARTFQRWGAPGNDGDGRQDTGRVPANRLTELERRRLIKVSNEAAYADLPPSKIVPKLADEGCYLASESTFYRVLREESQLVHRHRSKPSGKVKTPESLTATGPNQVYSWDITYLPTLVRGLFLYLYLVLDIYSRKIVGWQVYETESSALAADLMKDVCHREGVARNQVILHSDNGSPMKGATLLATLQELGILSSYSRPSVSNDNPYSESLFRTLKYRPEYPERAFTGLTDARSWVAGFVDWYNMDHLHSSIRYVTPHQRHTGEDRTILAKRQQVYEQARQRRPDRWSGDIRNWTPITEVHLNPAKAKNKAA